MIWRTSKPPLMPIAFTTGTKLTARDPRPRAWRATTTAAPSRRRAVTHAHVSGQRQPRCAAAAGSVYDWLQCWWISQEQHNTPTSAADVPHHANLCLGAGQRCGPRCSHRSPEPTNALAKNRAAKGDVMFGSTSHTKSKQTTAWRHWCARGNGERSTLHPPSRAPRCTHPPPRPPPLLKTRQRTQHHRPTRSWRHAAGGRPQGLRDGPSDRKRGRPRPAGGYRGPAGRRPGGRGPGMPSNCFARDGPTHGRYKNAVASARYEAASGRAASPWQVVIAHPRAAPLGCASRPTHPTGAAFPRSAGQRGGAL